MSTTAAELSPREIYDNLSRMPQQQLYDTLLVGLERLSTSQLRAMWTIAQEQTSAYARSVSRMCERYLSARVEPKPWGPGPTLWDHVNDDGGAA